MGKRTKKKKKMDEKVLFLPGAVGLQLEPDPQWGSRVVRFVDGGPWDPGPARACGKIQPGDWITCVQVNGMEATTFPEMMELLQQALCVRTLTVRSFARTVLESSFDSTATATFRNQGTVNDVPIVVSHQDTGAPKMFKSSSPNAYGLMGDGFDNEEEVKEHDEGLVRHLSQPIDSSLQSDVNPHIPTKNSLWLSPSLEVSTSLLLSLHPSNLPAPMEKQLPCVIHLPPRRQNFVPSPATLPVLFGTKLGDTYSISTDPRMGVLVGNHRQHTSASDDNFTKSETPETSSAILSHPTIQEKLSTLPHVTSFPGMVSLSSIHPFRPPNATVNGRTHKFGTTLGTSSNLLSHQWEADHVLRMFHSRNEQSKSSRFQSDPPKSRIFCPQRNDTLLDSQPMFLGRIALKKRTEILHQKPNPSTIRFSLLSLDQASNATVYSIDEKDILLQTWQQQQPSRALSEPKSPFVDDQNPNLDSCPSSISTQPETHEQLETKSASQEVAATVHELNISLTLEKDELSQVGIGSQLALSSLPFTGMEPADRTDSHSKDSHTNTFAQPFIKMEEAHAVDCPPATEQPTTPVQTPPPNNLLRKAKAKHQLSLARLRVKKTYQTKNAQTEDHDDQDRDSKESCNATETTSQTVANLSSTGIQESCQPITMEKPHGGHEPSTSHSPTIPPETPRFVPKTPVIDFARFSQEQSLLFEPGPIGLQLDHCNSNGNDCEYPAKVVRFVDGGPHDPGPARRSGRIQPGDFVVRVEAEGVVGTTYYTILHLLQKSWTTRKLTFRSAWEPLHVATTLVSPNIDPTATTPITPRPATLRSTPLNDSTPLPYQWTPLPYDWITKKRPQANTPEEQRALEQAYREEASRIIRERDEQKRRAQAEVEGSLQNDQSSWNFEDLVLGAVALTAESVAGCLRKQAHHDSDSDEDEGDHPKRD